MKILLTSHYRTFIKTHFDDDIIKLSIIFDWMALVKVFGDYLSLVQ